MKVLVVHNEYGKRSGEEAVVERMCRLFEQLGCEVKRLTRSTAGCRDSVAGKLRTFAAGVYCPSGRRAMREALREFRPDVVNVHNVYPFISPAALQECRKQGVRVIMTVHNFRLMCPTGLFMRQGAPCELCLQRGNEWGCVRHNCEGSLPKSAAYALRSAVARWRRDFLDCVDVFACITDFQRRKLRELGIAEERLRVIPNFVESARDAEPRNAAEGSYVGYVGRISREKGIDLIIEAARRNPEIPFRLAGAVADEELVRDLPPNVELAGFVSGSALDEFYEGARFVVMASRCYEGFPMSILEAGEHGRCVIAPAHGGFVEIIEQSGEAIGELFAPGDAGALAECVGRLWRGEGGEDCSPSALGLRAWRTVSERYGSAAARANWRALLRCNSARNDK